MRKHRLLCCQMAVVLVALVVLRPAQAQGGAELCNLPRCRANGRNGRFEGSTFREETEEACAYHFFEKDELLKRFAGTWILVQGASVTQCMVTALLQLLKPAPLEVEFKGWEFIDAGFRQSSFEPLWEFADRCKPPHTRAKCPARYRHLSADPTGGHSDVFRITYIRTRIADGFDVQNQHFLGAPWDGRRVLFMQTNVQYIYCWRMKQFCRFRDDLKAAFDSESAMLRAYEEHWRAVIERALGDYCTRPGTDCVVATADFFSPKAPYDRLMPELNEKLRGVLASQGESAISLLDNYAVSFAASHEVMQGHPSHFVNVWQYQRLLHLLEHKRLREEASAQLAPLEEPKFQACTSELSFGDDCYRRTCTGACPGPSGFAGMVQRRCDWKISGDRNLTRAGAADNTEKRETSLAPFEMDDQRTESEPETKSTWRWYHPVLLVFCTGVVVRELLELYLAPRPVEKPGQQPKSKSNRLRGLGFARYLASLHVALTHLSRQGQMPKWRILNFGFTWVPWFFMLSGFVLAYGRLAKEKAKHEGGDELEKGLTCLTPSSPTQRTRATESIVEFFFNRLAAVYPLYVVVLMMTYLELGTPLKFFPVQALLLQSFLPTLTERLPQLHCWFLSAILPFWLAFLPLFRFLKSQPQWVHLVILLGTVGIGCLPEGFGTWFQGHRSGRSTCSADILVILLKFNPVCYFHIFVGGISLGILLARMRRSAAATIPCFLRYGCSLGYAILIAIFSFHGLATPAYKLSFRLGALAAFQGLILLTLGLESDPLCRFFNLPILDGLGRYTFAQYLLQFQVQRLWDRANDPCYLIVLLGISVLLTNAIQKPCEKYLRQRPLLPGRSVAAVVLLGLLSTTLLHSPLGAMHNAWTSGDDSAYLPTGFEKVFAGLSYGDGRLGLAPQATGRRPCALINPSLAVHGKSLLVAARCHADWTEGTCDGFEMLETRVWQSDLYVGNALHLDELLSPTLPTPLALLEPFDGKTGEAWTPCPRPPVRFAANQTTIQYQTIGVEDPRLLVRRRQSSSEVILTGVSRPHGSQNCNKDVSTVVGKISDLESVFSSRGDKATGTSPSIQLDVMRVSPYGAEKNLGLFDHEGHEYVVHRVEPFEIWRRASGMQGAFQRIFQTSSLPPKLGRVKRQAQLLCNAPVHVHGGSNPQLLPRDVLIPGADGTAVWIGVAHTMAVRSNGRRCYVNFLYLFKWVEEAAAFQLLDVSSPLPIGQWHGGGLSCSWASGLVFFDGKMLISYGVCDEASGVFSMDKGEVKKLFAS